MAALHVGGGVAIAFDVLERLLVQKQHEVKYLSSWNGGFEGCHLNFYNEYKHIKPCIENYFRLHYEIKLADIVVCHSNMFSHIAAIECYIQNKPFVYGAHTDLLTAAKSNSENIFAHSIFERLDHIWYYLMSLFKANIYVVSNDIKEKLKQNYDVDTNVVDQSFADGLFRDCDLDKSELYNLRRSILQENTKYILLYAGRISKEKRLDLLMNVLPKHCTLLIIGDGPEREKIQTLSKKQNIVFINKMIPQNKLVYYYHIADLFVSPSNFETYGMSCHEALLCSTPVIVEDAQGFRSQIDHGKNGYLVRYENTFETMKCIENELENKLLSPYLKIRTDQKNIVDFILNSKIHYRKSLFLIIVGYVLKYVLLLSLYILCTLF